MDYQHVKAGQMITHEGQTFRVEKVERFRYTDLLGWPHPTKTRVVVRLARTPNQLSTDTEEPVIVGVYSTG